MVLETSKYARHNGNMLNVVYSAIRKLQKLEGAKLGDALYRVQREPTLSKTFAAPGAEMRETDPALIFPK